MDEELLKEHRELEYLRSIGDLNRARRRKAPKREIYKKRARVVERRNKSRST